MTTDGAVANKQNCMPHGNCHAIGYASKRAALQQTTKLNTSSFSTNFSYFEK
jgi:hypothetical protein